MLAKKVFYNPLLKTIAFIAAVALLTSSVIISINTLSNLDYPETILNSQFQQSYELRSRVLDELYYIHRTLNYYRSEEYIISGGTIPDNYRYDSSLEKLFEKFNEDLYKEDPKKFNILDHHEIMTLFAQEYPTEIKDAEKRLIEDTLDEYRSRLSSLNNRDDFYYYISNDGRILSNKESIDSKFVKSKPVYFLIKDGKVETNIRMDRYSSYSYKYNYAPNKNDVVYLAFGEEYFKSFVDSWTLDRIKGVAFLKIFLIQLSIALACIIYLLIVAGKRHYDDSIHLNLFDRIFFELQATGLFLGIAATLSFLSYQSLITNSDYIIASALISSVLAVGLGMLLSIAKHIKNKSFLGYLLTYVVLSKIVKLFRMIASSSPVAIRMFPTPKKAYNLKNIIRGTKQIKNGNLDYVINTEGHNVYSQLASDINNINEGLKASIDNELKSERLKTELITNVSHDIRTPLTSIITYIDLLKNEGLESENAQKYVDVIESKALRLKNLTDDLFEASKASTGNIPVELENIDIASLINQGMGELEDKIEESTLDFRLKTPDEKLIVKADGRLLWRVIENLMSNIFKYAMPNSRVYIDVINNSHTVDIIFKNISKYELNVNTHELMERFTRGEESRTSEGSGLGLNIAKSLIELQHGKFAIAIDGDLFKATITVVKAKLQE